MTSPRESATKNLDVILPQIIRIARRACVRKSADEFPRIQNPVGIENLFELAMKIAHRLAGCVRPPAFFGQTDSVFAGNDAAPGQDLLKQFVESALHFFAHGGISIVTIRHDVDMNVAVASMAETRDWKSRLRAQSFRELDKIDNAAARHDHVFI